jgi:hypothetical protein
MSAGVEPDPYYRAVEETFNRRRGAPLLLSPRDWALIGEWQSRPIPLRIVLQGIENCFDSFERRNPGARRINSLSYCRQEVLALHELYLSLHAPAAGRPDDGAASDGAAKNVAIARSADQVVARHLTRLVRQARASAAWASQAHIDPLVGALASAIVDLKGMKRSLKSSALAPEVLEAALSRLDAGLLEAARTALPPEEQARLEGDAVTEVGPAGPRMTAEAFRSTVQAASARLLRRRCRLPRLTLFA